MAWPKGRPNTNWRKKFYNLEDYHKIVSSQLPMPVGLRTDLAKLISLQLKPNETLEYEKEISKTDKFVIVSSRDKFNKLRLWAGRFYFTPQRLLYSQTPKWKRGFGFGIDQHNATGFRIGCERLLRCGRLHLKENQGFYYFELRRSYSIRANKVSESIRFYGERLGRSWYYRITDFHEDTEGRFYPTRRSFAFPVKDPSALEAIRSFSCIVEASIGDPIAPTKDCETYYDNGPQTEEE